MDDSVVIERILTRIDKSDEKFDTKISELKDDINTCKIDIQGVQKDLTNHLDNKKSETESFKRRVYIVTSLMGVIFATYAAIKEFILN